MMAHGEAHHEGAVQSIPYLAIAVPLAVGWARGLYYSIKERREAKAEAQKRERES